MDFDFNEAQNSFQFLQAQNKLPIKMSHKLELLLECINNQEIDTSVFHSLELEECQGFMKLNKQAQKEMFMSIIKQYAYANMIPSAIGEIKGIIDVRTKVLKSWKQKEFKIDSKQRTFEILRKKNSKKKPRIIYLQYYTVQPQEFKDKRYRFVIIANSEGHGYYKTLVCGSDDKVLYDKVIQALKTISQFKDHVMRGSILLESNDFNQPRAFNNQQSFITTRQDMKLVTQSEIIPQKQNMNIKITKQTVESDIRPIQQQQQQYQQQTLSQNIKQQPNANEQILQNDSTIKQQQYPQNLQQQQVQQPVIYNQLEQQQQQQQHSQQQQQQQQYQQQQQQSQQQQQYLYQQQSQIQKNQEEQYRLQQDQLIQQQKIDQQRQQYEQQNQQLQQQEQQSKILKQVLSQQENEIPQLKNELKYPQVFQMLFEEGKFNPDYFTQSNKQFTQVYSKDGVQILKDQGNSLSFRSTLTLYNVEIDKVFQCLAEIDFVKKWNAVINPNETKLLNLMQSENCGIIYERHKPYGLLYLPRDFVYLRYVTYRGDDILIVDKSIENEDAPPYMKVIRGEINYQITEIVNNDNNILVRIETEITNGGLSSVSQDCAITQWYLSELSHFQQFLKTYSAVQEIIQSPLLQILKSTRPNKQKEIIVIDQEISSIQQQQIVSPQSLQYTSTNQQQSIIEQQSMIIKEVNQPFPVTTAHDEQLKFEQVTENRRITLDQLPIIATVPETAPLIIDNQKEINEIQQYNKDIEDADLSNYTPSDFIQQTLPELSDKEIAQVKQMIKNIEQGLCDYTSNCIFHKYIQEPQKVKDEYITQINGGHYFLRQDWKRDMKHGGMIFYNQKKIEAQKRVIKFMLKSIGSNLLSGKSILNISLPVEVFESRSNLERFCYSFTFAPQILEKAAKIDNIHEQMKYTIAFGCSSIIMYMSLEKPFNPILGETYQGFINGCPVYAEQVSHHPPISAFQLKGRGYDIDGHIESAASMHANSVTGKNIGFIRVTYHNTKSKQIFIQCPGVLTGTAFGTRVFNINGRSYTIDLENNLIADMAFNPGSKNVFNKKDLLQDQFIGYLYKVKPGVLNKYKKEGYAKYSGIDFDKDVEQRFFSINGIWNQMVEFDGVRLFDTLEMNPHVMVNHPCPLPSDSNFRLDILYWKLRDFDNSQRTKEIYEVKQRNDRKWREKLTVQYMDRQKELYQKAVSLIKQEKYKEAYDEYLDVLLLKDQKNIEYNMLSGLCFQKQKNFKKAEEFYLYTLEKRPEDPKILNALFKLNKDDIKNKEKAIEYGSKLITIYKKTDIGKAMEAIVGYCEILHEMQERKKLDTYFLELLKHGSVEQVLKVAKLYIPLIIDLKLIDVTQPKSFNSIISQFSQKIYNQTQNFEIIENIARKVVSKFPVNYRDIIFGLAISKEHYVVLFDWLELLPSSCFLLDQVLRYCHCFLDYKIKFLLEQSIILLNDANGESTYLNYKIYDEEQYNKTILKAQSFLAFMRIYASQIVQQCGDQFLSAIDKLLQQNNFDIIEKNKDYTILELPLKVAQLFKSGNKENTQLANTLMVDFNKKMKQLKNSDFDVSVLEEVGANLGYDILADPVELMEMKNLLKIRIKNKAYSLETYEKYFDYQMKLVSLIRHYDEELSMQLIFEKILSDDPQNLKVQINYDWLKFSENKISQSQLIEIYQKYLPAPPKIEQIIYKRIGTLKLINNQINEAKACFEKIQGDDYEASLALGMIAFYQKQYSESLEHLYRAFNYCQTNYHLNQIIMFVLNKLKQKDKALEFAINIYKLQQFQNVYWLSFTIGQHLMQNVQFGKAHDILQKAADQFHFNVEKTYKLYYEKKFDQGDFSIPYFINQNDNLYLSDYPVFSSNYLVNQGMIVLTEQYFQDEKYLKLFKLEMKLAELKKILGLQGSALKSLEKAEELLLSENNNQISELDNYLTMKCDETTNKGKLIKFTQQLNQIQIQSRWVCTLRAKKIGQQYSKLLILHNFECAQLQLYGQQEYFSQERMIQGLLMSIHNFDDQEIQILIKSYLCFVFEIATQQIKNQLVYGADGVQLLAQKYLSLFELISSQLQLNVYACECLREFFYLLGIYHDAQYFSQSLKYSQIVIKLLCQVDIADQFDLQETFQHMRSILNGQDKKQLIVKNNLQSLLLTRSRLNLDTIKYLELSLSLFPKCDSLYCIAAQIRRNPGFILKALECNQKCQAALYQLGLLYIGRQNYEFAFQTLQKCIEVEPTTSAFAYLALSIILFIYLQQNYNIELPDCNKVKQLDSLNFYQNQLTQAISSYLDYVSTLQNTPIQNILSIIYRNLYLGYTITSEAILHDQKFKQLLKQFPPEYTSILYCEIPYIQNSTELENIYNKYTSIVQIKEEIKLVITQMNQYENINNNQVQWAAKLKYLIHLLTLSIDKVSNLQDLIGVTNNVFDMLVKNIIQLRQATNIFNFDVLFMSFVNKWYHYTRTIYLKDNSHKDYYLFVAKFQQQCLKLKELNEAQLINYIDQLMDKNTKITEELKHKLQFMELIYQGNWQEAITHLQLCIFHNPLKRVYRDILNKIHMTFYEQKYVQQDILDFRKTNQASLWLNTIINELVLERSRNISRLPLMLKIIKFKILPYADNLIAKLLVKVLCDIEQQISTEGLLDQIAKKFNIDKEKYWIKALIQKQLNEKQNVNQLILKYRDVYLEQFEDQIQWKKTALFFIPILTQLYFDRGSQGMETILQQIMQNYCLYAQQFLPKDDKLKKARFIYNMLHYGCYIKKLDDIESIGVTLTNLKEIADEFANQGTYNPTSLSVYLHYLVATEKYQELDKWLEITNQYIYNNDPIITWGQIIRSYHQVEEKKDINTLKKFITLVQQQSIQNPKLQSQMHYLIGQAMMNVNDWQQKYSKEEVLKKFQLALLLNPNREIIKQLQPLQTVRQIKQKVKLRLEYFEDVQQPKRKLKKKVLEGLNSDSDEALVDQMDYEEDQKEFQQEHGMTLEEHQQITESVIIEQQKALAEYNQQVESYNEQLMYIYEQQQYLDSLGQEEQQRLIEYYTQNYTQLSYEQQCQYMILQGYQNEQIVEYFYHQQQQSQESEQQQEQQKQQQ